MRNQFDMKLRVYGYKGLDKSQLSKKSVIETRELIKGLELPDTSTITDISIEPKNVSRQSRKIFNDLFPNLDRNIRIISLNEYQQAVLRLSYGKMNMAEFLQTLQRKSFNADAVNVPITFKDNLSCIYGETIKPLCLIDNDYHLDSLPILVSGYNLGSMNLSRLGIITHLHEVTRTLLERNKGSVKDYYKAELLSILIEKIAALEIDRTSILLSKQNIYRYENLKQCIEKTDDDSHKYLLSTLLAEVLFDKYEKGNETYKNHVLAQINQILEGNLVLEDFLISEGITLDNDNLPCFIDENIQKSVRNLK